eukprot:1148466-Pelagomonas_calceolata.AAC.2
MQAAGPHAPWGYRLRPQVVLHEQAGAAVPGCLPGAFCHVPQPKLGAQAGATGALVVNPHCVCYAAWACACTYTCVRGLPSSPGSAAVLQLRLCWLGVLSAARTKGCSFSFMH